MTVIVVRGRFCVHRVVYWAACHLAPVVIVGGAMMQVERVPVVVIVQARLFIFGCLAVLLLLKARTKAASGLLLLELRQD